jgi:hypothetical protein
MAKGKKKQRASLRGFIVAICTLLGGLAAAITFLPRITVTAADPVDPNNALSASFTIANTSVAPITLYHVSAKIVPGQIIFGPPGSFGSPPKHFDLSPNGVQKPDWMDHTLPSDSSFTFSPGDLFKTAQPPPFAPTRLGGADVVILVTYQPWLLPIERAASFRFVTHGQSNGHLYWYATPMD